MAADTARLAAHALSALCDAAACGPAAAAALRLLSAGLAPWTLSASAAAGAGADSGGDGGGAASAPLSLRPLSAAREALFRRTSALFDAAAAAATSDGVGGWPASSASSVFGAPAFVLGELSLPGAPGAIYMRAYAQVWNCVENGTGGSPRRAILCLSVRVKHILFEEQCTCKSPQLIVSASLPFPRLPMVSPCPSLRLCPLTHTGVQVPSL